MKQIQALISWFIPDSISQGYEARRETRLLVIASLLAFGALMIFSAFYFSVGYEMGGWTCLIYMWLCLGVAFLLKSSRNFNIASHFLYLISWISFNILIIFSGGISSPILPWWGILPVAAFLINGNRGGIIWSIMSLLAILFTGLINYLDIDVFNGLPPENLPKTYLFSVSMLTIFIIAITFFYEQGRAHVTKELVKANETVSSQKTELETLNKNLEKIVVSRTRRLAQSNKELGTFLYESSHALRRPLMRVIGLLSLLNGKPGPEEEKLFMEKIHFTVENMDQMLVKLVKAYEIKERDPDIKAISLLEIMEKTNANLESRFGNKAIIIHKNGFEDSRLNTDPYFMEVALTSILENAIDFHQGPEDERVEVWIKLKSEPDSLEIEIEDHGPGIPENQLEKIFDMFYIANNASRGNGLGLYLAEQSVQKLDGEIKAESEVNKYTRIRIQLPKA